MNKSDHIVHSGWMTKSPPEKKLLGPWKLFRSKWKRRFFVLSKPAGSLPGQYVLSYFADELCRRRKGHIDLEQCEQIIESLASEQYQYLFSIKTFHKSRDRTYFLGTDDEGDMIMWVRSLCQVCGLKQEDSPELPPQGHNRNRPVSQEPVEPPEIRRSDKQRNTINTQVVATRSEPQKPASSSLPRPRPRIEMSSDEESPYLYVSDCHTGKKWDNGVDRQVSRSSVPEDIAPLPPAKENADMNTSWDRSLNMRDSTVSADSLYKVPPRLSYTHRRSDDSYDVPPPRQTGDASPHSSSGSESHGGDSLSSANDIYKYPPAPRQFTPPSTMRAGDDSRPLTSSSCSADYYDSLPPTRALEAPPRPPRSERGVYQNEAVLLSDPVPVAAQRISDGTIDDDEYQVPPSNVATDLLLSSPPPSCSGVAAHSYMNMASETPANRDGGYLAMNQGVAVNGMDQQYTDMSGAQSQVDEMTSSRDSDLYQYPPPCPRPVRPSDAPSIPPRNRHTLGDTTSLDDEAYSIFSSERTRSFKRINGIDDMPSTPPMPTARNHKLPPPPTAPKHKNARSPNKAVSPDIESELIMYDIEKSIFIKRTPPAPKKSDGDLKYLDLDLDNKFDSKDASSAKSPMPQSAKSTTTEYREIDFVKTQALSDTKRIVEVQRKT